jgi:hypothetical protein
MNAGLNITGFYNDLTLASVHAFQLKHKGKVLKPWVDLNFLPNENTSTGYVYKTTLWWINAIACDETEDAVTPKLP